MAEEILNEQQWNSIHEKYDRLFWKISHWISGDIATASLEDNYQDLRLITLGIVAAYERKTGKKFDEFFGTKLFDQYFKTGLWNFKNNKGAKIKDRYALTKYAVSANDNEEVLQIVDKKSASWAQYYSEVLEKFDGLPKVLLKELYEDPTLLMSNGKLNIKALSERLKLSIWNTKRLLRKVQKVIKL